MITQAALNPFSWSGMIKDTCSRAMKSLASSQKAHVESWVEIRPYGFISSTYLKYSSGNLNDCVISALPDGSRAILFGNGSMIIESLSGHLLELDKRSRVVLVRVTKAEAEGAMLSLGGSELNSCYSRSANKYGQVVLVMPGNIIIVDDDKGVSITLPNGTVLTASKKISVA